MRMIFAGYLATAVLAGAASAGEFTPVGDTGGSYAFTRCTAPADVDVSVDPALVGPVRLAAHNEATRRFNTHIDAVNAYTECLADEASRDLHAYQAAVRTSLEAEQDAQFAKVEAARQSLIGSRR